MGTYYFASTTEMDRQGGYDECRDGAPDQAMCAMTIFLMAGFNSQELNSVSLGWVYELWFILMNIFFFNRPCCRCLKVIAQPVLLQSR
jgi:hypothetical protein